MSNNLTVFEKKEKRNYIAFQVKSLSRENDEGYSDSFNALDKYGISCSDDTCEQQVSRDIDDFLEKKQYGHIVNFDESIEIKVPICEKCQIKEFIKFHPAKGHREGNITVFRLNDSGGFDRAGLSAKNEPFRFWGKATPEKWNLK